MNKTMPQGSNISRRRKSALIDGNAEYLAKRAELVEIAARLFKYNGYQLTTLADIGKEAGLDRATVYYYVGSKEELFRECIKEGVESNIAEWERIVADGILEPSEKLKAVFSTLMKSYDANYPSMYVYIQEQMHQVTSEPTAWAQELVRNTRRFERIAMDLIAQCMAMGHFRNDISVRLAANALFGMFNWTHRWHKPGGAETAAEISEAFWTIFSEGMRPPATMTTAKTKPKKR